MSRRGLLIAVMAVCGALALSYTHADANWWGSDRGQVGVASWYGNRFHGRETASGERFSMMQLTAAHRYLPLGTKVIVTNLATNEAVEVKINDRGPFAEVRRRIIDLSRAAADTIGLLNRGVGQVQVMVSEEALELRDANDAVMYEVQVGAFLEIEQAQEMVEQLQRTYAAAYIATREGPFGSYHRVRIGPFEARREAHEVAQGLVQEGYYVFLDEVAASSLLHQRLRMAGERGSQEFKTVEPARDDSGGVDVRGGMAYYMHSFD
jgi:peptidoglycan lytic transglycosylase